MAAIGLVLLTDHRDLLVAAQGGGTVRVPLSYQAPGEGPAPNFSPQGTQVGLTPLREGIAVPADASRPAKTGVMKIGPNETSWVAVLAVSDPSHPLDLTRLYLDRNRNGRFDDDGPALTGTPAQNEKTKAWWTSINNVELSIPFPAFGGAEPYMVSFWMVRDGTAPPAMLRYSVRSWRSGAAKIAGVDALVAAMDGDNNGVFDRSDSWSVLEADAPGAATALLSHQEARVTSRLMYVKSTTRELVLEFRSFSPDGRFIDLAVVDRPSTKTADRAADDVVAAERSRPRAATPFTWGHDLQAALAEARTSGRKVLIDFEATWCGPCKTMDEWIWTDAEVAALLVEGYVGVKIDGDVEKVVTGRFDINGYPTMIVLDPAGKESHRFTGYLSSTDAIAFLKR